LRIGLGVNISISNNVGSSRQKRGSSADFVGKRAMVGVGFVGDRREGEGEHFSKGDCDANNIVFYSIKPSLLD